ncbi:hypothetical protein BC941DRAFT_488850 [Chlamydoabsidia padenii]|nr:hypothetical protein BC941DRAFT_488850 [Chlamydoabsidia padenii]
MVYGHFGTSSSNSYYNATDGQQLQQSRIQSLKKAIREQHILLTAAQDDQPSQRYSIDDLKERIIEVCRQINEQQTRSSTSSMGIMTTTGYGYDEKQWWSRYQTNARQLEDLAQQKKSLVKEMDYLVNVNIKDLKARLEDETNRWAQLQADYNKTRMSSSASITTNLSTLGRDTLLSDSDRLKAKAQAMVAARLKQSRSHSQLHDDLERVDRYQQAIHDQIERIDSELSSCQRDMDRILQDSMTTVDSDIDTLEHDLRQRQIFEKGLFASDELSFFIDSLRSFDTISTMASNDSYNINNKSMGSSYFSSAPKASRRASYRRSLLTPLSPPSLDSDTPPPIPTTQRPDSPRSSADIKAEARRRIEQRPTATSSPSDLTSQSTMNNGMSAIDEEEKAAQERLRQAETEARQRLLMLREKRDQARQEAAAAEEKRRLAAVEAAKKAEAEMAEEKKRRDQEARERMEQERRQAEELAERQRKLDEEARLEQERRDAEQQAKEKLEDETRQRRARMAAQQAAKEKRRLREEQEARELEAQLAREAEERERRQAWEQMERENRQQQQEQAVLATGDELAESSKAVGDHQETAAPSVVLQQEDDTTYLAPESSIQRALSPLPNHSEATAGTSGYGVDMDDEVDFSSTYRAKALYAYQGMREDDLSFAEDEMIKAHPSKDKNSDWWYGTSLSTHAVGFFPRTYIEIIEKDDLGFGENEILLVQPFQDENGDWWYGTNEETGESGYFPKSFVEVIETDPPAAPLPLELNPNNISTSSSSHSWKRSPSTNTLTIPDDQASRGLSAPSTPVMKKTSLDVEKQDVTRRRRAASNASATSISQTSNLQISHQQQFNDSPIVTTWARTMDDIELQSIPSEERSRQEAIYELITTERSYLCDLQMIVNIFYTDSSKYLQPNEQDVVFSNIDDLLLCNTAFYSDLETRQRECANVSESLKCYSTFCRNQSFASRLLQKKREDDQWFEVFLKTAQTRPECRSLDLSHFLLQPVQRITRYPLLLRQILKSTPKRHPDYGLVKSALTKASQVLDDVNEETRRFENHKKMGELGRILDMEGFGRLDIRGREFVMEGVLYKTKSGRKLQGYLFNDLFLLVEPLKSLNPKGYLYSLYREPMNIERLVIRDNQMTNSKSTFGGNTIDETHFQIVYGSVVISVKAASQSQKRQWINQIQHYSAIRSTMH